jgi:hypothetical protein
VSYNIENIDTVIGRIIDKYYKRSRTDRSISLSYID